MLNWVASGEVTMLEYLASDSATGGSGWKPPASWRRVSDCD